MTAQKTTDDGRRFLEAFAELLAAEKMAHRIDGRLLVGERGGSKVLHKFSVMWEPTLEALIYAHSFGQSVPEALAWEIKKLTIEINRGLPVGQFGYHPEQEAVLYRHGFWPSDYPSAGVALRKLSQHAFRLCECYLPWYEAVLKHRLSCEQVVALASGPLSANTQVKGSA